MLKRRLIFMGTPTFAVPALEALIEAGHDIVGVYSQPPKPAGRGYGIQKSSVQLVGERHKLNIQTPKTLRDKGEQELFSGLGADLAVVAAYGLILPVPILSAPKLGCINIHASLLPRWRGAAPIQRAILEGDTLTGVTTMQMAEGLDTGDILLTKTIQITSATTASGLQDALSKMGAECILETLQELEAGTLEHKKQPTEGVTYAAKLTRADGLLEWTKPADELDRKVRGLQPWPGCYFLLGAEPIKVLEVEVHDAADATPGTLVDKDFTVACGHRSLRLVTVQRSGKKPIDGASLLRGLRLPVGAIVG